MSSVVTKAKKAIKIIKDAANSSEPSRFFDRKFDDIFENGNGDEIVNEIVKNYFNDEELKKSVVKVKRWIPIEKWIEDYFKSNPKPLF